MFSIEVKKVWVDAKSCTCTQKSQHKIVIFTYSQSFIIANRVRGDQGGAKERFKVAENRSATVEVIQTNETSDIESKTALLSAGLSITFLEESNCRSRR